MSQQNYSPVNSYPGLPPSTDIISGSIRGSSGIIVGLPPNRTFAGSVSISGGTINTSTTVVDALYSIATSTGTNTVPASTGILHLILNGPISIAGTSAVATTNGQITLSNVIVAVGTSSAALSLCTTNAGNADFGASVAGVLL